MAGVIPGLNKQSLGKTTRIHDKRTVDLPQEADHSQSV